MSDTYQSLSHARWNGKYHVVFVPKRRRKTLYSALRKALGALFHAWARQKECRIMEGHVMPDHGHLCLESPPQHAVASVIGFLKGKSAIAMARQFHGRERNFTGEHFWARGYAVATVGVELEQVRAYIRDQQSADEEGRLERNCQRQHAWAKTPVVRSTAFAAALLSKPPALPGVSDFARLDFTGLTALRLHDAAGMVRPPAPRVCCAGFVGGRAGCGHVERGPLYARV